jgi:excisionase family DNA binding protein
MVDEGEEVIMAKIPEKTLLRADEVAECFGVSRRTVYDWVKSRKLIGCNPGGRSLRIFRESVLRLLKKKR